MKTADIRRTFLDYFKGNQHTVVPTSSLVPANDPTLLFTNAGMVQFKDVFLGADVRPYQRAVTSQRCVRAGGKHNDLDNVGYTARHHTFFEMLGNFSFGDYFKEQAIHYAWELLTEVIGLPADKLWVTVFEEDDEAADIWLKKIGVPQARFARIGAHANFWSMGDTGPCGPCSEIFFDHGPDVEGGPPGTPEEDGDRYVEIWNLVFMQFNRDTAGTLTPLPKPSVDTGMGLERLAAVLQGVHSNYEIDLFVNLIDAARERLGVADRNDKSLRVIADHIRSTSFLIADGVTPSNEGRGYVLRRIIRRAIRHGYQVSGQARFMHDLVAPLVDEMGVAYPELVERQAHVERVLRHEGERFSETLDQGLSILSAEIDALEGGRIPGDVVFKLYDTYGFPADLTADVAREKGLEVDDAGFEAAMQAQRERARAASHFDAGEQLNLGHQPPTQFTGYDGLEYQSQVLAVIRDNNEVDRLNDGEHGMVVLDQSPFYAESGGQVGDVGQLQSAGGVFEVTDTQALPGKIIAHIGKVVSGHFTANDAVHAQVLADHRYPTARNHSATHLLHAALQTVVGDHVQQKGSLVLASRLRFDFSHHEPLTQSQLLDIETRVNDEIIANHPVAIDHMALEAAKAAGAAALFGEKYDENVRTIRMGPGSFELCGGTHVQRTGDIGLFRITSENGVAAGVRRVEAMTGAAAVAWSQSHFAILNRLAGITKSSINELEPRIKQINDRVRALERTVAELQAKLAAGGNNGGAIDQATEIAGIKILTLRQDDMDVKTLRTLIDQLRNKVGEGIVVVGSVRDGKASVIAGVSQTLSGQFPAGDLAKQLAQQLGGRGGGKPVMGQGGGPDTDKLDEALSSVPSWIEKRAE